MPLIAHVSQASEIGFKTRNDDAVAFHLPHGFGRRAQTLIAAIADGVSASAHSNQAAAIATRSFCADFFGTDSQWAIKTAGYRVLESLNRWLHGHSPAHVQDYLTTFSALVIQHDTAHLFHVGDSRIWRWRAGELECLTHDHVIRTEHGEQLIRALGLDWRVELDYLATDLQVGDRFVLTTDGIHGFVPAAQLRQALRADSVEQAQQHLMQLALDHQTNDNYSCQIIEIVEFEPEQTNQQTTRNMALSMLPDTLQAGQKIDGYQIMAELQISPRSSVYRAERISDGHAVILKSPSPTLADDPAVIDAFLQEEWIGQRLNQPDVVKTYPADPQRRFLYLVQDYLVGLNLRQWKQQHPNAPVQTIIQFAKPAILALRALHRRETLHHDIKPDNLFLTDQHKLMLIDFGSASVGSMQQSLRARAGAAEYAAPEYALGQPIDWRADQFALAMTLYELLTDHLPYGDQYQAATQRADFEAMHYCPAMTYNPHVPAWMDAALMKACHLQVEQRYTDLGEFLADLTTPNVHLTRPKMPLAEKYPVQFWQTVSALLLLGHVVWLVLS
ncbi:MAG: bifunctional protein-serine/threonine kinase/phosphatase [Pseudomonadota bacterium]|nr:bifunctional protein-serine/threonine kinase/phosphatase [Pseudomonadota bacterium]